jgi:hypothetical protein
MPLIRPDRARPIDRIIDYFGGAPQRSAPASPFHGAPWPGARRPAGKDREPVGPDKV